MITFEVNFRSSSTLLDMTKEANQPRKEKNSDFGLPPTDFKPLTGRGSQWLKITVIIGGIVLAIGTGIVYWFFYYSPAAPAEKMYSMHKAYERAAPDAEVDDDAPTVHPTPQDAQINELAQSLQALKEELASYKTYRTAQPPKGTITKINTPQGRYYVIVGGFIDDDLASDQAHRLAKQGVDVMLIAPAPGKYFYHVAVEQADSFDDANKKLKARKATYGKDIWVMKY